MNERRPLVAVIGGAQCSKAEADAAEEIGRRLALEGIDIVCGGRGGIMEAVCKGAFEAGGRTIGILPGSDDRDANRYLSIVIPTSLGEARNVVVATAGEVVIAIAGSHGTLSEIAFALKRGKVVIGLNTWDAIGGMGVEAGIRKANSIDEVVALTQEAIKRTRK
jgi:uncharacterized protein (TIGR00725 family)